MIKPRISTIFSLFVFFLISVSCSWMSAGQITPQPDDFKIPSSAEKSARIYFHFYPMQATGNVINPFRRGLEDNPTFKEAVYISEPPKEGVFCKITSASEPRSPLLWAWVLVSGISIGIIPFYDDRGDRTTFTYELYVDNNFKKSYHYVITARGLWWIGAPLLKPFLPSDWTGSLVDGENYGKAIIGTARAFWLDAHADGFF